jgi:hypothetical protein
MTKAYKASISMTFEPDENGYLEWEDEYGLTPEEMLEEYDSKPRTEDEMKAFFHNELWEYLTSNLDYHSIYVEEVAGE